MALSAGAVYLCGLDYCARMPALAAIAEDAFGGDQAAGAGPDLTALVHEHVHGHVHGRGRGRGVWSVECGACV